MKLFTFQYLFHLLGRSRHVTSFLWYWEKFYPNSEPLQALDQYLKYICYGTASHCFPYLINKFVQSYVNRSDGVDILCKMVFSYYSNQTISSTQECLASGLFIAKQKQVIQGNPPIVEYEVVEVFEFSHYDYNSHFF